MVTPAHKLRVEANALVAEKQWAQAAEIYEKTATILDDEKEAAMSLVAELNLTSKNLVGCWYEHNQGQVYNNLIWCYLHTPGQEQGALANLTIPDSKDWKEQIEKLSPTDPGPIVNQIKQLGLEAAKELSEHEFAKAHESADRIPNSARASWKTLYRVAQVSQCRIDPTEAMKLIEKARRYAETASLFYNPEKEKKSALRLLKTLEESVEKVLMVTDENYVTKSEKNSTTGVGHYLSVGFTPLPPHPRIPIASVKEELLALRLIATTETAYQARHYSNGRVVKLDFRHEASELLNKILTTVAQVPFQLFPATGSSDRVPPISVHLLAFYFRACLSEKAMREFKVEEFCMEATEWMSDEEAYSILCHAFKEVEAAHSPYRGHSKSLVQSGCGGCMPCTFRLLRSGDENFAGGLQQAAHFGKVEWVAFCLNRLLTGFAGKSVLDTILVADEQGCNAMMHACNDNFSGLSGLTIRLMAQAVSFETADVDAKPKAIRKVLNTTDGSGFTPALACISIGNTAALSALVDLGARLWDKNINSKMTRSQQASLQATIALTKSRADSDTQNMIRALESMSNEQDACSYCGKPPKRAGERLLYCSRCNRASYCGRDCQKAAYKKHKYVCSTAKVQQDKDWYSSNISVPKP